MLLMMPQIDIHTFHVKIENNCMGRTWASGFFGVSIMVEYAGGPEVRNG